MIIIIIIIIIIYTIYTIYRLYVVIASYYLLDLLGNSIEIYLHRSPTDLRTDLL